MTGNTQSGLITELLCQTDFAKYGIMVYLPITNDSRSDMVVEINHKFYRIQCKSCTESADGNSFTFSVSSKSYKGTTEEYKAQIDYFYTNHNGQGYLIPVTDVPNRAKTLRLNSKEPNHPSISWAKDYTIEKVLFSLQSELNMWIPHKRTEDEEIKHYCINCGKLICDTATRCQKCNTDFLKSLSNRPSRGDLKAMIRTMPFTQIGAKFGVSDNAVRKWCDNYGLPRKTSDIKKFSDEEWNNI